MEIEYYEKLSDTYFNIFYFANYYFIVHLYRMGTIPVWGNTLLIWDMNWQYASFFAHLHDILHGNASALYSFSRAIGGNMLSVAVYYLMSPFNLLFLFFDAEHIYIGILIVSLLKVGTCGITMQSFLNRKYSSASSVIFSTCYALSSYVI